MTEVFKAKTWLKIKKFSSFQFKLLSLTDINAVFNLQVGAW